MLREFSLAYSISNLVKNTLPKVEIEDGFSIQIKLLPNHVIDVKLHQAIQTAKKLFLSDPKKSTPAYEEWQKDSYQFLKACFISLLNLDEDGTFTFDTTKKMEIEGQNDPNPTKIPPFVHVYRFSFILTTQYPFVFPFRF